MGRFHSCLGRAMGGLRGAAVLAAALTACTGAMADDGPRYLNVRWFGAIGDGVTDDRAAIQAALDAADTVGLRSTEDCDPRGAIVFFPEGVYRVTSTLSLNTSVSIELMGVGIPAADVRSGGQTASFSSVAPYLCPLPENTPAVYINGPTTAIVADFSSNGPLFSFTGQVGHKMRDMALFGCPAHEGASTPRTHCTALIQTGSSGWGNTANYYSNLLFWDAQMGVSLGLSSGDVNNSEIVFDRINAGLVDTVFQPQTPQALNLVFRMIAATSCKTVFDFDNGGNGGGNVSVDTASFTSCGGTCEHEWMIKTCGYDNNGVYRFSNIRWETDSEQLLRMTGWGRVELMNCMDARNPAANHPPLIKIRGGGLTVSSSDLIPSTSGGVIGTAPVVTFDLETGHAGTVRLRDCLLPTYRPIGGGTGYLSDVIVTGSLTSDTYYRIDSCDGVASAGGGNGPIPLTDAKSASSW